MDKVFTSIENQIGILKSRGLVIDDEPAVKSILSKENYYNLINGYKSLFLDSLAETETFLEGTTFSEIYELYLFDRELRSIFMRWVLKNKPCKCNSPVNSSTLKKQKIRQR